MEIVIWKDPNVNISIAGIHATGSISLVDDNGSFYTYYDISVAGQEFKGKYQLKGNESISGTYKGFQYKASINDWNQSETSLSFHVKAEVKILAWWKSLYDHKIVANLPKEDSIKAVTDHIQSQMIHYIKENQIHV
ncbi:hypothetical protein [Marinifilum sp.]|uniref:hypothetical protein n=1 Tax=Marinifilum sp. TaxID=2033137 RepID=UPI003BACE950